MNGDQLTGKVLDASDGKLRITVGYSGQPVLVEMAQVKTISVDQPIEVRLKSGETLKGLIQPAAEGKVTVTGADRGAVEVPWPQIEAFNPSKVAWHGSITLAGTDQMGNTERLGFSAAAEAQRRGDRDNFAMRALFNYAEEGGRMTTRNIFGSLKYDYYFSKRFYGYVSEELYTDAFRDLKLRTVTGGGLGWQIAERPRFSLALEAGVAHINEDYNLGADSSRITARLAGLVKYNISNRIILTDSLILMPSLQGSEFIVRNEAGITTPLGSGWNLKFAHIFEYSSEPPPGIKNADNTLIVGLQYGF